MHYRVLVSLAFFAAIIAGALGSSADVQARTASLDAEFGAAAEEFGAPKELLLAMGYVNTRWEMPSPGASEYQRGETDARGNYGIMALLQNPAQNTLGQAADLTGVAEDTLKVDRKENIRGGAAVLSALAGEGKPEDLNGWYDAVAEYGGGPLYADEVFGVLQEGASGKTSDGERVRLAPQEGVEARSLAARATAAADFGLATWHGAYWNGRTRCASSINYCQKNRPYTSRITRVIIHVAQGSYSGTLEWFKNPRAGVSAHYTVSGGGAIGQSVREADVAYHAGNWTYNKTSIGIEHAGYVSDPGSFTNEMYHSSARLTAYLTRKYGIPVDRAHIIGHSQVPRATHTDPGRHWNWDRYMNLVRQYR